VFWVRTDTRENLISDFVVIARLLNLPEQDAQEQLLAVKAVQEWLRTHGKWLLILDNADDLKLVLEFLPPAYGGHLLLTTRAQNMGRLAHILQVEKLEPSVGALFLLHRAGILSPGMPWEQASSGDRETALEIARGLDGLPLALDQAGAYIEEAPCSIQDYLRLYRMRRTVLLKRRGGLVNDHPESVATTWSLAFGQVEKANPTAADLLRLCAFLHPEAIPEELFTAGASQLGPLLQAAVTDEIAFNDAIIALRAYSLVQREAGTQTLSLHRLVQVVLKDAMDESIYDLWAERTVRVLAEALPNVEFKLWPRWERFLPHALACVDLIAQNSRGFSKATEVMRYTGWYLGERGRYAEAEPLYQRALAIREQQLGAEHPDTATSLNDLAEFYKSQGKCMEAEPLYQRALAIYDQQLGSVHPYTVIVRKNYVSLLRSLHREAEAMQLEIQIDASSL
jgi:tetratricopeptide (TPR) repeat protein